ncbi:MAG TPA: hypothetical protein VNE62_06115 [Actinomycetota bacterium]|nr:hypothetical protein [Actinomycetota bacterium]
MTSTLYPYTLTAHRRGEPGESVPLDGTLDGADVLAAFDTAVVNSATWVWTPSPEHPSRRLTVEQVHAQGIHTRYGRIRVTRPAIRHDVEQASTGSTIKIRDEDHEGRPLFFWMAVPAGNTTALLLTERRARFGIVDAFWKEHLVKRLKQHHADLTVNFSYYFEEAVWDQYRKHGGAIHGATLTRVLREEDESLELDVASSRRRVGTVQTKIEVVKRPTAEAVANIFRRRDRGAAIELLLGDASELGHLDDYDTFKLTVEIRGKTRSVNLASPRFPPVGHAVEGVPTDEEGYPQIEAMAERAVGLARDIGGPIGIAGGR